MIKKLNNGKWYVEVYLGKDKLSGKKLRKTGTFNLKKEAVKFQENILKEHNEKPVQTLLSLKEYLEYYHEVYVKVNCRIQTQKRYKVLIKNICDKIGHIKINDLTTKDIEYLYYEMSIETIVLKSGQVKKRYVSGTILKCHKLIKHALNKAVSWDLIYKNPAAHINAPQNNVVDIKFWTRNESEQFFNFIRHHKIYLAAMIAFRTGLRLGEVCALRSSDLFLDYGYLKVNHNMIEDQRNLILSEPKTASSKNIVYLPDDIIKLIRDSMGVRINNKAFVCCHEDGSPLSPSYLTKVFTKLVKDFVKICPTAPVITFHGLRHTHATMLNELGVSPIEICHRVRHSRISTTFNTYIHLNENLKKNTVKILNDMSF